MTHDFEGLNAVACGGQYDPWKHAEALGLPVIYRHLEETSANALYSEDHRAIFVKPNLHRIVERCAIAHEIVHFEYSDRGRSDFQERRANRVASKRLIRQDDVFELTETYDDLGRVALELEVTVQMMQTYMTDHGRAA